MSALKRASYYISSPRKEGDTYTVEIRERIGGIGISRSTRIKADDLEPFIKSVFREK